MTAKALHPTTDHTRIGATQSPMEARFVAHQPRSEADEVFGRVGDGERGFAFSGAVAGSSMFPPSAAGFDSGSSIGCVRALHDENTYEAINTERRANSSSITVCP